MQQVSPLASRLDRLFVLLSLTLGVLHVWMGRYAMNPDGISYLDVGENFYRHHWSQAINAWWSPFYPWAIGLVVGWVKPTPRMEFPLVHLVNLAVFILALFAFRFLLHSLLATMVNWPPARQRSAEGMQHLPDWAFVLLAYPIFLWVALEVETVYDVSPDLAVVACFSLAMGFLLHLEPTSSLWKFGLFGVVLGLGYWTKAVLFPLGLASLAVGYWWRRSYPSWRRSIVLATLVFLFVSAPLVLVLSLQKRRFTIGDVGKANYAWYVSPHTFWRNWQGEQETPHSGSAVHPTRELLKHPPLFEFDGPIVGTYPPWTDPSYWNEGLQWHFKLKPQLHVLVGTVPSEGRLLARAQPALVTTILAFVLFSGSIWLRSWLAYTPLILLSLLGLILYLPMLENDRYLGGFLLVLFLTILAAVHLPAKDHRVGTCLAIACSIAMIVGTLDYTVRVATDHMAIPGTGPNSTTEDLLAAQDLRRLGLQTGDKVAVIGDGTGAYWARLAKLRIVAEIMGMNAKEFWSASPSTKETVYKTFAATNAKVIVTACPCPQTEGWQTLTGTAYCARLLQSQ